MNVTVVRWKPYSESMKKNVLIELAYPYRDEESAINMFMKEYPNATNLFCETFDADKQPNRYSAYKNSECVRFWKAY